MKLTLIFLLCLVVTSSYQYRSIYEPRQRSFAFYYPMELTNQNYQELLNDAVGDYSTDLADIEARRGGPVRRLNGNKAQSKFFGTDIFAQWFNPTTTSILPTTFTSTIWETATSTLTIPSIKSCIASAQFITVPAVAANPAANPPVAATPAVTSTGVCARRRRAIEVISPTQAEALVKISHHLYSN
jgi:hypothetical protein